MSDERPTIAIIIPALNEEVTIGAVVAEARIALAAVNHCVDPLGVHVVDNGSTDRTAEVARNAGAIVVPEPRRGYGRACLSGIEAATAAELIVLLDGDLSDRPDELPLLLAPILAGQADLVLGSRTRGTSEPGALLPQQRFGNRIAAFLLRLLYGIRVSDVGPFRVINRDRLLALGMQEMTYGWSAEMIARAARHHLRIVEVPVSCRRRGGGTSKVSGNVSASIRAGCRMLATIARCSWPPTSRLHPAPVRVASARPASPSERGRDAATDRGEPGC